MYALMGSADDDAGDLLRQEWLRAPYGPQGHRLCSLQGRLNIVLSFTMFLCMAGFAYVNARMLLRNSTAIEDVIIEEKTATVYASTSFAYRSPYDIGWWRNVLSAFRVRGDDAIEWYDAVRRRREAAAGPSLPLARRVGVALADAAALVWLVGVCTLQRSCADGVHYSTVVDVITQVNEDRAVEMKNVATAAAVAAEEESDDIPLVIY